MNIRSLVAALVVIPALLSIPAGGSLPPTPPLDQHGGTWPSGHVQGIAVDLEGGYVYYSFTNLLAKLDFQGRVIGTIQGWSGHLGDLDFNPIDGKVYGSLEYKQDDAFYAAAFDVDRINRVGMRFDEADAISVVYLPEVVDDFIADLDGDGIVEDKASSPDHRYGTSGIDGISFGPAFGSADGRPLLSVAYGIYGNVDRQDNDHQVILQYDTSEWAALAQPLVEGELSRVEPAPALGQYFVRTGNTTYGIQNLAYEPHSQRWLIGVYQGRKPEFPNYTLFSVDATTEPAIGDLIGVPAEAGSGWRQGRLLTLSQEGRLDETTGIRGWHQKADVGMQPIGGGLVYVAQDSGERGRQSADIQLMRWTGEADKPFHPASQEDLTKLSREGQGGH